MTKNEFFQGTIEITTVVGCKNNCSYCPQKLFINSYLKKSKKLSFSFEDFKICLSKIPKDVRIDFSGLAEPFLNPNCAEFILYAFKEGFSVSLFTTLIGLKEKDYLKIKDLPFIYFYVHLPDNENRTGIKVDKKYLDVLNLLIKNAPKNLCFIYYGSIYDKIVPILKESPFTPIRMKIFDRAGNLNEGIKELRNKKGKIYCKGSKYLNHNVLFPSGDVTLCCADYGMKHILGNLLKEKYSSLFKSKEYLKVKESLKKGGIGTICHSCEGGVEVYSIRNLNLKTRSLVRKIRKRITR
jgi:hypothetical protein